MTLLNYFNSTIWAEGIPYQYISDRQVVDTCLLQIWQFTEQLCLSKWQSKKHTCALRTESRTLLSEHVWSKSSFAMNSYYLLLLSRIQKNYDQFVHIWITETATSKIRANSLKFSALVNTLISYLQYKSRLFYGKQHIVKNCRQNYNIHECIYDTYE